MTGKGRTRNEISGGIFFSEVVQGRDITVILPPRLHPALAGLPDESKVFVGHESDLHQLTVLLDPASPEAARVRVSAVAGLAGIGKTELVLQAAHAALRNGWFPGGVLFVDMFGYDPQRRVEASAALEGMLRAAGIPGEHIPAEVQDRSRLFSSVMAAYAGQGKPILMVVDNVSSSAEARPLLPVSGKVVVTSRHTLADLNARLLELDALTLQAGVDLLGGQLHLTRGAADTRVADQPDHALSIARLCAGLPLALRIVAALLAAHSTRPLSSMAADLQDARTRLDEMCYSGADGELAVRSAFDLSYRQLDPQQARTFRLLTLNPGPEVSTEAGSAMMAADQRTIRRHLEELARAHLIEPGSSYGRWRMHDLVRLYAMEQGRSSAGADDRTQATMRLLEYYGASIAAAAARLNVRDARPPAQAGRADALAWFDAERPNLLASVGIAAAAGWHRVAYLLTLPLGDFLSWRRYFADLVTTRRCSLNAARQLGDRGWEGAALGNLGIALCQVRKFEAAITTFEEARVILREVGDRRGEANALNGLGDALREMRSFDEAVSAHQEAAAIFRAMGDLNHTGHALANLGVCLQSMLRPADAIAPMQQAIAIFRQTGDRHNEGKALNNLAMAWRTMRRPEDAVAALWEGLAIFREFGDRHSEAMTLTSIGIAFQSMGLAQDAIIALNDAAAIFRETGDRHSEAMTRTHVGNVLHDLDQNDEEISAYQEAAAIFRETGDHHSECSALNKLGLTFAKERRYEEGIATFQKLTTICDENGYQHLKGEALLGLALTLLGADRIDEAKTARLNAAAVFRQGSSPLDERRSGR